MKAMKYLLGAAFAVTLVTAGPARADIANSAHDLSGGTEEICVYCHTPHSGDTATGMATAPLWNRTITSTTFTMYSSPTATMVAQTDPQGVSLACLSCHDGVTGYNSIIQGTATDGTIMALPRAVGQDGLGNDHPISVTYDPAVDPDFNTLASAKLAGLPFYDLAAGSGDQVECATCHDPHDPTDGVVPSFLRMSNVNSALCTTCHTK